MIVVVGYEVSAVHIVVVVDAAVVAAAVVAAAVVAAAVVGIDLRYNYRIVIVYHETIEARNVRHMVIGCVLRTARSSYQKLCRPANFVSTTQYSVVCTNSRIFFSFSRYSTNVILYIVVFKKMNETFRTYSTIFPSTES